MKKTYILTIASIGLFIGFWLGYSVFASVHIKVICRPSGKILLDVTRSLLYEFVLSTSVEGCESIDLVVSKPTLPVFFEKQAEEPTEPKPNETIPSLIPSPQEIEETGKKVYGLEEEPQSYTKVPYLEIFDICIRAGCMEQKAPYYIVLDKNETHLILSFYGTGLNETHVLSDSISISNVFVQDLATLPEEVEGIEIYGALKDYFSLSYTIESVLEGRVKGVQAGKEMMIITLNVDKNIVSTEWSAIKFYLRTAKDFYYLGDIFFFIT